MIAFACLGWLIAAVALGHSVRSQRGLNELRGAMAPPRVDARECACGTVIGVPPGAPQTSCRACLDRGPKLRLVRH